MKKKLFYLAETPSSPMNVPAETDVPENVRELAAVMRQANPEEQAEMKAALETSDCERFMAVMRPIIRRCTHRETN